MTITTQNNNKSIQLPVIFYDGETQIPLGNVHITPTTTTYKTLQHTLSNKIGISPNHITIYYDNNNNSSTHHRRRQPVTSKFDFRCVRVGQGFYFLVVLKRTRRSRKPHRDAHDWNNNDHYHLEYINKLRADNNYYYYLMSSVYGGNSYGFNSFNPSYYYGNNNTENYDCSSNNYELEYDNGDVASCSSTSSSSEWVFCDVCYKASGDGEAVPFHWCRNDVVTTGFRSIVGPIAKPGS